MTMVSYAQNREDVVLARAFGDQIRGFYIDVGAEHPVLNSVTKHFYDQGWRGINIEPSASALALLDEARPEDINLGVGVSDAEGKATFYEGPPENHGASTFRRDVAARYQRVGQDFAEVADVPVTTLTLVCEEYAGDRVIDFLKIDVEGLEAEVIAGADWARWRPRVVVVEATQPNERTPSHDEWEPTLLSAGYVFALFDGLNRFYALADEPELVGALGSPACVFDDYIEAGWMADREERDALAGMATAAAERDALADRVAEDERQLGELNAEVARWQTVARRSERQARLMEDRARHAEDEVLRTELGAAALRDRVAGETAARMRAEHGATAERAAREAVERELAALRATKTFRWVGPLRRIYGLLRGARR